MTLKPLTYKERMINDTKKAPQLRGAFIIYSLEALLRLRLLFFGCFL
jgi:hypothetical protein